jgi:O-antigen/teichoic acid export membrane protein
MAEERVSRSATFALGAQLVGAVLTAFLTIYLGRALSKGQFGAFTFALSVILIAMVIADLGVTTSTGRFLAERRERPQEAAAVFRTSLRLKALAGLPAAALLFALAGPICDAFGTHAAIWPLRGCAIALLGQSVFLLFLGAFIALGKVRYNLVLATIESVAETLASVLLVVAGAGATGAAFGRAIGYAVGVGAGLFVARRVIGALRRPDAAADHAVVTPRRILSYAGPLLLIDAAFRVFASIDVLLIAALIGGGAPVAAFGLTMRLADFLDYPAGAVGAAVSPRLARRRGDDVALLGESLRYLLIVQMLVTAPLLIWPEAAMHLLFGSKYPEAAGVLRALTPFIFLAGIAQPTTLSVNYLGMAGKRVPIAAAMLALNIVIDVILLPRIGIVGAAIGTSAAYALWVPAHVEILRRRAGLRLRPLLVTTARTAIAGAAMVGVLALIGTGQVAIPLIALGTIAGPAVYVGVLLALRELTPSDLAVARRVLARKVAA